MNLEGLEEILLSQDGNERDPKNLVKFVRADFEFIDLKTLIEKNGEKK